MPEFNRFDICSAYYHYASIARSYYTASSIIHRLTKMGYRPGLSDSKLSEITPNAKEIYMNLIRKEFSYKEVNESTYKPYNESF